MQRLLSWVRRGCLPRAGIMLPRAEDLPKKEHFLSWMLFFASTRQAAAVDDIFHFGFCVSVCHPVIAIALAVVVDALPKLVAGEPAEFIHSAIVFILLAFTRDIFLIFLYFEKIFIAELSSNVAIFSFKRITAHKLPWHESSETGKVFDVISQARNALEMTTTFFFMYIPDILAGFLFAFITPYFLGLPLWYGVIFSCFMIIFMVAIHYVGRTLLQCLTRHFLRREQKAVARHLST